MLLEVVRAVDGQPDVALGAGVGPGPAPARPLVRSSARPLVRSSARPLVRQAEHERHQQAAASTAASPPADDEALFQAARSPLPRRTGRCPSAPPTPAAPRTSADAGRTEDVRRRQALQALLEAVAFHHHGALPAEVPADRAW